jgi:predicted secreted protein
MSITLCLAIYFVVWWTTLFAVLPFGLRTQAEDGEVVPGTPESAPSKPRLARVFLINTVVAAVVFAGIWLVVRYQLIPVATQIRAPG